MMTADDYEKWAEDYRQNALKIEKQLEEKKRRYNSKIGNAERAKLEKAMMYLFEQKVQLNGIAKELSERAKIIREREERKARRNA
jgi:ABC-type Zn uptake system ZnuABC Zn-binding protein ZnuA